MTDERRTYPDGVPCWIDVEAHDPAAARAFYGGLFGWTFEERMPPDAPTSYSIASLDGAVVAAIGSRGDRGTAAWNTYVAVSDLDAVAAAVATHGGRATSPPDDAGPAGRSVEVEDGDGARFRLWQAGRRNGVDVANIAGAWNFSDLHTDDGEAARSFYGGVFGWEFDDLEFAGLIRRPGYGNHLEATIDPDIRARQASVVAPPGFEDAVAWLVPLADGERPHWHVTFAVADRDAAAETAIALGADDLTGPIDTDWTRTVTIRDPQGAVCTLSQFTPPGD